MKKIAMISFVVAILGFMPAVMAQTLPITSGECVDLIAGQTEDVGEVCVSDDGTTLTVTYMTSHDPWWTLFTTHLHIWVPGIDDGPKVSGGGPSPGQFAWTVPDLSDATSATYNIPLAGTYPGKGNKVGEPYNWTVIPEGDEVLPLINIAAHSVVGDGICNCEALLMALPDTLTLELWYAYQGSGITSSYFEATITDGGLYDGKYLAWCADPDADIEWPDLHPLTQVYSSLCDDVDDLALDLDHVKITDNLDLVNYVLNHKGDYTIGDIQYAIWMLLADKLPDNPEVVLSIVGTDEIPPGYLTSGQGYTEADALQLIADAREFGEDFWPACGEVMAVILVPPSLPGEPPILQQSVLIEVPAPCCEGDETAWGEGYDFPGKNWAMFFTYELVLPE